MGRLFSQGFDPCRSKGTILRYPYLVTDRKIFLEARLAPIYTTFEGGASDFSVFLACLAYFCLFLKNLLAAQNILSKWSRHSDFEELRKSTRLI